ncbi:DUF1659 domain-containing protein [Clostridium sp. UBA1652]|uniref:DUF1659 domain-containing protein n=1 Tax=Clostridium sp. UBA1652 TaxID=1946348 RepID=UPI00257D1272|nr:DUF1659 domain-containing protein [Clostridium sp. UBA1652]
MVEAIETSLYLIVKYKAGLDKEGKDIFRNLVFRNLVFRNINPDSSYEDLYAVGDKIGRALGTQIYSISKETTHELINI